MNWEKHIALAADKRNACKILVKDPHGRDSFERIKPKLEDGIMEI
jgi:hypothetical protein